MINMQYRNPTPGEDVLPEGVYDAGLCLAHRMQDGINNGAIDVPEGVLELLREHLGKYIERRTQRHFSIKPEPAFL